MTDVGRIFGDVLGGNAFGDWSLRPEDGRAFTEAGIALYHAPRTMAGEDRFDPSILLEVCDWIRDREDCQFIILGPGDSDYQVLVDRARALECRMIRCAFRPFPRLGASPPAVSPPGRRNLQPFPAWGHHLLPFPRLAA